MRVSQRLYCLIMRCVWGLCLLGVVPQTLAQLQDEIDFASIDAFIDRHMLAERIPGVAVAFLSDYKIVHERGFGTAARSGVAMDAHTPSALGSLSKSFTAIAVMQLVEEGAINLDAPVANYLTELKTATDFRIQQISVRQLLNHTSGFSTFDGNFGQADYSQQPDALDQLVARLTRAQLNAEPGTRFEYSNGNYQILGLLIERHDQVPFEVALRRRVLDRVGMSSSFVLGPDDGDATPAEPFRYWLSWPVFFSKPTARSIVAQGGVYASAHDVATYVLDLLSSEPKLLSAQSRDQLFGLAAGDDASGYGLGWFVEQHEDYRLIFHGGSNPGFETIAGFVPERGSGFVVLVNAGTGFIAGNVSGFIQGIKARALRRDEPLAELPASNKLIALVLVLMATWLVFVAIRWCQRLVGGLGDAAAVSKPPTLISVLVPSILFAAIAYVLTILLPRSFGIPLPGVIAFAPDIGTLLAAVGGLSILCLVLRSLYFFRYWLRHRGRRPSRITG